MGWLGGNYNTLMCDDVYVVMYLPNILQQVK